MIGLLSLCLISFCGCIDEDEVVETTLADKINEQYKNESDEEKKCISEALKTDRFKKGATENEIKPILEKKCIKEKKKSGSAKNQIHFIFMIIPLGYLFI